MYRVFILLLGMFLCSCAPAVAQTVAPQIIAAPDGITPIMAMVRAAPLLAVAESLLQPGNHGKSAAHFSYLSTGTYDRDQGLERLEHLKSLSQVSDDKTLFSTQSRLPLVHFWGGHFQFDGFTSTLDMQNTQLGPSGAGGLLDFRPRRQDYPGEPRPIYLLGVSLSFHIGRNAQIERPTQRWRSLARMVSAVR
jgi:hypothetical protein